MPREKKPKAPRRPRPGKPTLYRPEYNRQVEKICLLGAIDQEVADFFGVNRETIHQWKKAHPEFLAAMRRGKQEADMAVAQSLFKRANGYQVKVDKIFQYEGQPVIVPTVEKYPPDASSMIFWLKNRRPDLWRDKHDYDHTSGGEKISLTVITVDEQTKKEVEKLK